MSYRDSLLVIVSLAITVCPVVAAPLTIDGDLSDWGVMLADNNGSTYNFRTDIGLIGSTVEDQDDNAGHGGYLGPNQGGQDYDAEMMAVALQGNILSIAIATGQRPDNGLAYFAPGDIRIETAAGDYGIEIGGGVGGGPGALITQGASGSAYNLNANGYTISHAVADPLQTAGSIWTNVQWILDPINPPSPTQFQIDPSSSLVGMADFVYTRDSATAQHAVVELAIDLSVFGGTALQTVRWGPSCGNDELDVTVPIVPEPATMVMLVLGFFPFARRSRTWV